MTTYSTSINGRNKDYGSTRAQLSKAIAKAQAKLTKESDNPTVETIKRTVAAQAERANWAGMFSSKWITEADKPVRMGRFDGYSIQGTIELDAPGLATWAALAPEPPRFNLQFRDEQAARLERWLPTSEQMRTQLTLAFPPVPESEIFRIEHAVQPARVPAFCSGPYGGWGLEGVPYSKTCPETGADLTPGPYSDELLIPRMRQVGATLTDTCYFGFESLEAMKTWFSSDRFWESTRRANFVVRRYKGVVFHGRRQSVIDARYGVERLGEVQV